MILSSCANPGILFGGNFEAARDSLVVIETETGCRSGILMKMDDGVFVLTSQNIFKDRLISIKTLSGKALKPVSFEAVSDEQNGLLRIKTDSTEAGKVLFDDGKKTDGEVSIFKTSPRFGIISELKGSMQKDGLKLSPAEKNKPAPAFIETIIGSPIISKSGKLLGVVGEKGIPMTQYRWIEIKTDLFGRKNMAFPVKTGQSWVKLDSKQMAIQCSMISDAEVFLPGFAKIAEQWCQNPYKPIDMTVDQPEKMKAWIQASNGTIKDIPAIIEKIKDGSGKMGDSMKNVSISELKDQARPIGKRLCDFCPFYQRNLTSSSNKWESPYLKKKAADLSEVYKAAYEGICKEFENSIEGKQPL